MLRDSKLRIIEVQINNFTETSVRIEPWFGYIINQIPVRIRIKIDTKISHSKGHLVNAFTLFRNLRTEEIWIYLPDDN